MTNVAIKAEHVQKIYKLYDNPIERLKEALNINQKKYYRNHYALQDISFEVYQGEIFGIIGTNGSGKSTILKLITGVLTPSSGVINVFGKVSALLELGAGFNQEYTGMENIYLNGTMMGYTREEIDIKLKDILEFADIGDFIYQPVKTYSSGMFARLAFAVAISVNPDILIVDEVLAVGDTKFQVKCLNKIKSLQESGTTILYVSHDIYSMRNFCDRVMWIEKGVFKSIGPAEPVIQKYQKSLLEEKNELQTENIKSDILQITEIFVNGQKDIEVLNVKYGSKLEFKINYNLYKKLDNVVVGIAILDEIGEYITGVNTKVDNFNFKVNVDKINSISLIYPNLQLLPGEYLVRIAIFEENGIAILEERKNCVKINVLSDKYLGEGYVLLEREWRIENEK